jgi:hypothetical protein
VELNVHMWETHVSGCQLPAYDVVNAQDRLAAVRTAAYRGVPHDVRGIVEIKKPVTSDRSVERQGQAAQKRWQSRLTGPGDWLWPVRVGSAAAGFSRRTHGASV